MKNLSSRFKIHLAAVALFASAASLCGQVTIYSTNLVMTGSTNDGVINIKADSNPTKWNGRFYRLPADGTNIITTNGIGIVQLVPGIYTGVYVGLPKSFKIYVTNSAGPLNMADLTPEIVSYTGVQSVTGSNGIIVTPPTGAGGVFRVEFSGTNNTSGSATAATVATNSPLGALGSAATNSDAVYQAQFNGKVDTNNVVNLTTNGSVLAANVLNTFGFPGGVQSQDTNTGAFFQLDSTGLSLNTTNCVYYDTNTLYTGNNANSGITSFKTWTNNGLGAWVQAGNTGRWITNFNGFFHIMTVTGATSSFTNSTLTGFYASDANAGGTILMFPNITIRSPIIVSPSFITTLSNRLSPAVITPTGSAFSWTNLTGQNVFFIADGSTVFSVAINGVTIHSGLAGEFICPLQTNEWTTVTYTVAPSLFWKP